MGCDITLACVQVRSVILIKGLAQGAARKVSLSLLVSFVSLTPLASFTSFLRCFLEPFAPLVSFTQFTPLVSFRHFNH